MSRKYKKSLTNIKQYNDLITIIFIAIVIYFLAFSEDLYEKLYDFTRKYDFIEFDEIFIVLTTISLFMVFFYFNKWKKLKQEISTRKEIENSLRRSQNQYKDLFESAHDAIIIFTPHEEIILDVNERACQIYGFSRSEFIGMSLLSISKNSENNIEHIEDTLKKGFYHSFETTQLRKDGSEMHLEINASVVNYKGQTAILSINRDVTERKEIEKAYRESEAKFKALVNNSSDIIFVFDDNIHYKYISPAFEKISGYKIEEKLNKYLIDDIHPEDQEKLKALFAPEARNLISKPTWVELRFRKKNGEYIDTESIGIRQADNPNISGVIVNARDITQRKQAERELLLYSNAIKNISDGVIITDLNNNIIFVNQAFTEIYGYSYNEVTDKHISILTHHEDQLTEKVKDNTITSGWYGELWNKRKDGTIFPIELTTSTIFNDKDEIIGLVGIVKDITERKRVEKELLLYSHAIRNISDGVIITDIDNNIIFVNQAFTQIYGYTADEVINKPVSILAYYEEEQVELIRISTIESSWYGELLNRKKDGTIFPIELTTNTIVDDKEEVVGLIGVFKDISERKKTEERLKESEKKYRLLAENSTDMLYIYSLIPEPHYEYISPSCKTVTGYSAEDGYNDPFIYHNHLVTKKEVDNFNKFLFSSDAENRPIREKWKKKDGSYIWVEQVLTRNFNENGNLISFQSTVRDITDRHTAEQALKESENRFRSLYENSTLGLFRFSPGGKIFLANPAFINILGYDFFSEVRNININKNSVFVDPDKRKEFKNIIETEDTIIGFEVEWYNKNHSIIFVRLNGKVIRLEDGTIDYYECTIEDITERKEAELAHQRSEMLLEATQRLSKVGGWEFDIESNQLSWTKETYRIHDLDPDDKIESLEKFAKVIGPCYSPEDFAKVQKSIKESITKGISFDLEFPFVSLKGNKLWLRATGRPIFEREKIIKVIGNVMDITEQKNAEEKLRDSERRFKSLYENATIGIFRTTPEGNILLANPAFVNLVGYDSEDEFKSINLNTAKVYYDINTRKEFMREVEANGVVTGFEAKWYKKDGSIIYVLINARVFKDSDGNVKYYDGTLENITERKEAEEALRKSEAQYRHFFEKDISGNYLTDVKGDIISCNTAFAKIMGYDSAEELLGSNMVSFYPNPTERPKLVKLLKKEKVLAQFEIDFVRKDKKVINCIENVIGIFDANGELVRIQGYMFDITEQKQAEEELKNSELKYRTVADWTYDWEYWIGPKNEVYYMSPSVEKLTGYSVEEFTSNPSLINQIIFAKDLIKLNQEKKEFEKKRSGSEPFTSEFRILTKNSQIKWIAHLERNIYSSSGEYLGIRASNRDITESKKSIEQITRLSTVIEQSPLSIIITDNEGIIEYINPEGTKTTGYTLEEIKGSTPRLFKSGETNLDVYKELWTTIKTGRTWTGELLNKTKTGELIWENILISPIYDSLGTLSNFVSVREDITEKKKNEEELAKYREQLEELVEERTAELRQSEDKYRILAENSDDVIVRYDRQLNLIYINEAIEKYFDTNYKELVGKSMFEVKLPKKLNKLLSKTLLHVFRTGEKSRLEFQLNDMWIDYIAVPELNLEGEVYSVVASARDITRIKESERKVNEALQKEKELNEFKSKFISTASHQFRTPLASILSSSQMIKRYSKKWDENKINEHHSRINDSITNLTQIMDDLLTISKTQEGRYNVRIVNIDVDESINKLISEVDGVNEEKSRIKFINNSKISTLNTDKKIFSEIVNNLLTNALKYSPSKEIVLVKARSDSDYLEISFIDKGIGISEEDQKYIFDSFFRGKNGLDKQGTGLGLNIVKRGVDLLKGDIKIESELGKGTTVIVKLPIE